MDFSSNKVEALASYLFWVKIEYFPKKSISMASVKSEQFLKFHQNLDLLKKLENPEKHYKSRQRESRAVKLENSEKHYKSRLSD